MGGALRGYSAQPRGKRRSPAAHHPAPGPPASEPVAPRPRVLHPQHRVSIRGAGPTPDRPPSPCPASDPSVFPAGWAEGPEQRPREQARARSARS